MAENEASFAVISNFPEVMTQKEQIASHKNVEMEKSITKKNIYAEN